MAILCQTGVGVLQRFVKCVSVSTIMLGKCSHRENCSVTSCTVVCKKSGFRQVNNRVCRKTVSVANMGFSQLLAHADGKKHISNMKALQGLIC